MGRILDKLLSGFISILTIIIIVTLVALDLYSRLAGVLFLVVGMALMSGCIYMLVKAMHGPMIMDLSSSKPPTLRKQTLVLVVLLVGAIIFLVIGILAIAGYTEIEPYMDFMLAS